MHPTPKTPSPWPRRLAFATVALTFPLLLVGGTVTTLRVGMAVPDWPTTFGDNMFTYPLGEMLESTGVSWEHSHRLVGALVGFVVLCTAVVTWIHERRRFVRNLASASLVAVCLQGLLGGLRVTQNSPELAFVHGAVAQAVFTLFGTLALVHTRAWGAARERANERAAFARRLALATVALVYVQIVVGAWLRHAGGLAPLALHAVLAAFATALVFLSASQLAHAGRALGAQSVEGGALARLARRLRWIVATQIALGLVAALMVYVVTGPHNPVSVGEAVFATLHVAVGAFLLQQCMSAVLWTRHALSAAPAGAGVAVGGAA